MLPAPTLSTTQLGAVAKSCLKSGALQIRNHFTLALMPVELALSVTGKGTRSTKPSRMHS